jgi:DNA processing protein
MPRDRAALAEWLAIVLSPISPRALARLAGISFDAREIRGLSDRELAQRAGLDAEQLSRLRTGARPDAIERALALMERHRIDLLTLGEPGYPRNLMELRVPPGALFVRGRLEEADRLCVALVGSRSPTPVGAAMAERLGREFAALFTVASGCATGIDSAAHRAALDSGGRTIGVVGCGLDVDYPAGNRALREQIAAEGALVSVFPPGTPPRPKNFPRRNEVLAGLSLAVVVLEAGATSGALSTARAANEEGRPVYAVPGDPTSPAFEGSNGLLRDGATACMSARDVVRDLEGMLSGELAALRRTHKPPGPKAPAPPKPAATASAPAPQKAPLPGRAGAEGAVLALLADRADGVHHDEILAACAGRHTPGELAQALLMLELDGLVAAMPGKLYRRA